MIIAVMGLIGSGKSTLAKSLCSKNEYIPFIEPTKKSEGASENPYLDDYYVDPSRWAFTMQVHLLFERYKQFQEANYRSLRGEDCVIDSCYYSDYAFAIVQHEDGYFTENEFKTYERMHETLQPQLIYPDVIVFLELSPENTLDRIKIRSRDCEAGITLEYLQHLNKAYEKVLRALEPRCKVVRIDATASAEDVMKKAEDVINETRKEIEMNGHPCYK